MYSGALQVHVAHHLESCVYLKNPVMLAGAFYFSERHSRNIRGYSAYSSYFLSTFLMHREFMEFNNYFTIPPAADDRLY